MKIIAYDAKKGQLKVQPDSFDDLWVLYNVIRRGDQVYARTSREIKIEEEGARPTKGKRIALALGVGAEKILFQKGDNRLRINGVIVEAPEKFGLMGSHHTINIALGRPVTILKHEWLSSDLTRVKQASQKTGNPILVVSIDDEKACVAILRQHGIDVKVEITEKLPGKLEVEKRGVAISKYVTAIAKQLVSTWSENHGLIAVVGPGFWKELFVKHIRETQPNLFTNIAAVRTVSNGGVAGVNEAVRSGVLDKVAKQIRVIEETRAVDELLARLGSQRRDVSYGLEHAKNALRYGAIEQLLVVDALLRDADDARREELENYMRDVEKMRGRVMIVSAQHEAGKKLIGLGGIAALLRFAVE